MVIGMFAENVFEAASNGRLLYQCCSVLKLNWIHYNLTNYADHLPCNYEYLA